MTDLNNGGTIEVINVPNRVASSLIPARQCLERLPCYC